MSHPVAARPSQIQTIGIADRMAQEFYILDTPAITCNRDGFFSFSKVKARSGTAPECDQCGRRLGALRWEAPHQVKLQGERAGDICCGTGDEFLVSDKFRIAWSQEQLGGLSISENPVRSDLLKRARSVDCIYHVATPKHSFTLLDAEASGLVVHSNVGCTKCGVAQRARLDRVRVDIDSWDGAQIFHPTGLYGVLLATAQVKSFVEEAGFSNFQFRHQDDYSECNEY